MSISVDRKKLLRTALIYLGVTAFTALFGGIYELFSHEIYSYFMIYAFACPLLLGVFPYLLFAFLGRAPHFAARAMCQAGTATLTVGSLVKGVLEIYGTSNYLAVFYPITGGCLLTAGIVTAILVRERERE